VIELFNGLLSGAFQPTKPFLIAADKVTLDFFIAAPFSPAKTEWYLEFTSDDPNMLTARWAREVAEEDVGGGVTHMPPVVRDFPDAGFFSNHFVRQHHYVRVQIREVSGAVPPAVTAIILAPFGVVAASVS